MPREIELKYQNVDHEAVRSSLQTLGAERQGRHFEANIVFDTPGRELRDEGTLLRLRRAGVAFTLTLKRRPGASQPGEQGLKVYDETETGVADFDATRRLLAGLGYQEVFRYEKWRETWRLDDATVCLDTLPFGDYVEIEAAPEALRRCAQRLGLGSGQATDETYHELNRRLRRERGLAPRESFVFEAPPEGGGPVG